MKDLEEVLDIHSLVRKGYSQRRIAHELGISRKTVRKYLEHPELAGKYVQRKPRPSKLDPYVAPIENWLEEDPLYSATSIYDRLRPLGFGGSYEIVKRRVRTLKEKKQRVAYLRFETEPGRQAQADFGEFQVEEPDGSVTKYYLFAMILGYSRKIYAELLETSDLVTFLDCHIRAFAYFGGVPDDILYDRMRNVYIGKLAGKNQFNSTLVSFALHYGFTPLVAPAYAPWVKGKVERPFSFIREGFWRGYGFTGLHRAKQDLLEWLRIKDQRVHGTTHEVVEVRFERERPKLAALPPRPFDTSYRVYRKVYKDSTVRFEGNSFVVPHKLVGQKLVLRVKEGRMRIFRDDELITAYRIPEGRGHLVQHRRFYEALGKDLEMNARKYHHARRTKGKARRTISPRKPPYELDVEVRPIEAYSAIGEAAP